MAGGTPLKRERVGQEIRGSALDELAVAREEDAVDAELEQPLPAAATGRCRDREHLDVARPRAFRDGARESGALGALIGTLVTLVLFQAFT